MGIMLARGNPFQRRGPLALSSLRSSGQALSASEGSLSSERSFAGAQDDTLEEASFDSQSVFFEMDWKWITREGHHVQSFRSYTKCCQTLLSLYGAEILEV